MPSPITLPRRGDPGAAAGIPVSEKGAPNGVATLNGTGKVPASELPSYVDDVLEFADLASFPVTGETGKIYVALDTNLIYRWTGSTYVEISQTDHMHTNKTQLDLVTDGDHDIISSGNPHSVTKSEVGLGNVPNLDTADAVNNEHTHTNKTELDLITDGDHDVRTDNPHSVDKADVGLGNVENTKVKLDATVAPTVNNDVDEGYTVGSRWIDVTADKEYVCLDNTDGAAVWVETTKQGGFQKHHFFADQVLNPNNADWAVNSLAPAAPDSNNAGLIVRLFDDTVDEGIGLILDVPIGATNIVFGIRSRAETAPGAAAGVVPALYVREIPDNAAAEAWSSETDMTTLSIPTNEYFQYDSQSIALTTLGLVAGRTVQIELIRNVSAGGDDLSGDWVLLEVVVSFT